VATVGEGDAETVVGVGEYQRLRDPTAAEAAFAIADAHQGRGIGTRLVEQLAERAARHGIQRFVAEVLADNHAMLGVFEALGFELSRVLAGGGVEVIFPIARTVPYELRLAERDHIAVTASLRAFFEPSTVAVIGASRRRGTIGGELFRNILESEFVGAVYPVNRNRLCTRPLSGQLMVRIAPKPRCGSIAAHCARWPDCGCPLRPVDDRTRDKLARRFG
jgi:hypothetical protein